MTLSINKTTKTKQKTIYPSPTPTTPMRTWTTIRFNHTSLNNSNSFIKNTNHNNPRRTIRHQQQQQQERPPSTTIQHQLPLFSLTLDPHTRIGPHRHTHSHQYSPCVDYFFSPPLFPTDGRNDPFLTHQHSPLTTNKPPSLTFCQPPLQHCNPHSDLNSFPIELTRICHGGNHLEQQQQHPDHFHPNTSSTSSTTKLCVDNSLTILHIHNTYSHRHIHWQIASSNLSLFQLMALPQ